MLRFDNACILGKKRRSIWQELLSNFSALPSCPPHAFLLPRIPGPCWGGVSVCLCLTFSFGLDWRRAHPDFDTL